MEKRQHLLLVAFLGLACLGTASSGVAQEEEEQELGITNSTELSLVVTDGNSNVETLGFKNTFRNHWEKARYSLRLEAVRSNTGDDRFAIGSPDDFVVVVPEKTLDVENYLIDNRYDRQITERFFWNVGLSWDRNKDAGILNRYVGFAGVGNIWWDRDDLKFNTSYGLSHTDREEEDPDPEKDDRFAGFRFSWQYLNQWGKNTTYENDWMFNTNFSDPSDWTSNMTNSVAVSINSRLALKVSLQWLFNNFPALEEIDLFDEQGNEIGTVRARKEKLDTIFSTSLVINF